MIEILFLSIIVFLLNAMYILGINCITYYEENINESRMLLWRVRFYSEKWFGPFWSKPICTCGPCMCSLHSTYIYFPVAIFLFGPMLIIFLAWPVYALALAGFVKLVNG